MSVHDALQYAGLVFLALFFIGQRGFNNKTQAWSSRIEDSFGARLAKLEEKPKRKR